MNRLTLGFAAVWLLSSAAGAGQLDDTVRRDVIERIAGQLEHEYAIPELGESVSAELRQRLERGEYAAYDDGGAFAERLTRDLRRMSDDAHLHVEYSAEPIQDTAGADDEYDARQMERYYGAHRNFGFRRVEHLEGNIGLLVLDVFAPVAMGGDTAVAAMHFLANTRALIVDLRNNSGGHGEMVNLLAAYLFDQGGQPLSGLYWRPDDKLTQTHVQTYVPGPRYGEDKPVYVLISERTFSAAENFAYDLQALERVTVIGETSGGGAHPFEYSRLTPHFVLSLVKGRSVNPITGGNWQGTGVKPDIAVSADQALERALALARETSDEEKAR